MGEIKSTLDLVMERTRHLTLSDEEKIRQRTADFEKRLQGLLQQYADGALDTDIFGERMTGLQAEMQIADRRMVVTGVIRRIDPDGDHGLWLTLLGQEAPDLCQPLDNILEGHRRQRAELLAVGQQDQLDRLANAFGISGTAVTPNPSQDPACRERLVQLKQATQTQLAAVLDSTAG
jgi:hypothetical protein